MKRARTNAIFWFLGAALCAAGPAFAKLADDKICFAEFRGKVSPAEMIAACTAVAEDQGRSKAERAQAYANRAAAKMFDKDNAGAESDLTMALEIDPGNASALANRGSIKKERGDLDGAIRDYDEAIRQEPALANVYLNRGLAWLAKRDYARAIDDLTYAIKNTQVRSGVHASRSRAYFAVGQGEAALDDLNRGLRIGDTVALRAARCQLRAILNKDIADAEQDCAAAIERKPDSPDALTARGHLEFRKGQFDVSLTTLDAALTIAPRWETAIFLRAVVIGRLGRLEDSKRDLARLRAQGSDAEQIYAQYGIAP